MKLSLIVHANRDRGDRVQCLLTRLTLNKKLNPDVDFEVVVFDGGSSDNTKDICDFMSKILDLKYVYVPLNGPIEETYALSIASKFCTGDLIGFVSADHWISENLVRLLTDYFDDQHGVMYRIARSETSKVFKSPVQMVDQLLDDRCSNKEIESIMELAQVESEAARSPEVWSVRREELPDFGGCWLEALRAICEPREGVAAIDMWSPPQDFIEPPPVGEFAEYSYVVIDEETLEVDEAEEWSEQRS